MRRDAYSAGRLTVKPTDRTVNETIVTGIQQLPLNTDKENLVYIPKNYDGNTPASLAIMLHGSGGIAAHGISYIQAHADEQNIILLAPASHNYTWDIIADEAFNRDVILIDGAMQYVFEHYAIDPNRIAIGGFSDGASYALCIGLTNGDLYNKIIAFSPGFSFAIENNGHPSVFISHGVHDHILPINSCSRRIVPQLKKKGLNVTYQEFDGEHVIPADICFKAVHWFINNES
jgi:predicted esterase